MNDFHMTRLAASRVDELRAEAERHRIARNATSRRERSETEQSHHPRRFSLDSLLRRANA